MTPKEKYLCIIANEPLRKADVIVVLEGDGLVRVEEGARLYKEGWAPLVVLSGGFVNPPHSIPASEMHTLALELGIPPHAILLEERSQHTRGQAEEIILLAKKHEWKKILLVASHYHQYRAYLTFLKMLQEANADRNIVLINAPARHLPWFASDEQGRRADLLLGELDRIAAYQEKGHVASFESALEYQEWKEKNI